MGILVVQFRRTGQDPDRWNQSVQTIPSLALLCFLIPIMGIGALPTIFALFLYGSATDRAEHDFGTACASMADRWKPRKSWVFRECSVCA